MSNTFGFRLGVEGEREFKSKLSEINQSMKVLGSELKKVSSEFDGQDKSVRSLSARNEVLKKSVDEQKTKVQLLTEALKNASDTYGENDRRTKDWQIKLNNATAELNKMERELDQSERELADMEKAEREAAESADKLANEVDNAGDKAKKSGRKLISMKDDAKDLNAGMDKAAAGIKKAALAIGAAIAAAGTALTSMTVDAAAYADEIITASTVTGMSKERLQAYSYAADLVDVSLNTLTGSMRKNINAMKGARDGTDKYVSAYKKLGVQVTDTNGNLRNSEDVYWEAIDALGKMTDETERDALAMDIFGKSAQDLNPLIAQGSKGIEELTDEAKRMGAVLDNDTLESLGEFDDSVQRLKQGFNAAKTQLGTVLLPELQKAAQWGIHKLSQFTNALKSPQSETRKLIDDLKEFAKTSGKMLFNALKVVADVLLFLAKNIKVVVPVLGTLVTAFSVLHAACAISTTITAVNKALSTLPATASAAKVAMTGLSAAMNTNIVGVVLTAIASIAGLVIAFKSLSDCMLDNTAEEQKAKAIQAEMEAADEAAQSFHELKQTYEEQAQETTAQMDRTKELADELSHLADESGRVKDADKARVEFILGELNDALGTEYELTGNQIENYQDLKQSIYDVIEAKKAQILLDTYEQLYTKAVQNRLEVEKAHAKNAKEIAETQKELAELEKKAQQGYIISRADVSQPWKKRIKEVKSHLNELETEYAKNEDTLKEYYDSIYTYETASTQILSGNSKKAVEILESRNKAFIKASDVIGSATAEQRKTLKEQYDIMVLQAETLEKRLKSGVKGVTQEMVDDAKAMAEKAGDEYEAVGGVIPERMANGVNIAKGTFTDATREAVRESIAAGKKAADATSVGANLVDGMSEGVWNRKSAFRKTMRELIRSGIAAAKVEAEIKSPSRRTRKEIGFQLGAGAALGVSDSTRDILSAISKQMQAVKSAYKTGIAKHSLNDTLGNLNIGLKSASITPVVRHTAGNVINIYPQSLTEAQTDYLIQRVNADLGGML